MSNESDFYEEVYEMCQEAINPHMVPNQHGMYSLSQSSLIPSVVESLEYLIEFWLVNRNKEGIDLCGVEKSHNLVKINESRYGYGGFQVDGLEFGIPYVVEYGDFGYNSVDYVELAGIVQQAEDIREEIEK